MSNRFTALFLGLILVAGCFPLAAQTYTLQAFHIPYAPNAHTFATGINNRGAIVGYFSGPSRTRGFKRDRNGVFDLPFDDPNAAPFGYTTPTGINNSGVIVGYYWDPSLGRERSFLLHRGVFTDYLVDPYESKTREIQIHGINNKGDLVGQVSIEYAGTRHGFVSINGVVSGLDLPGCLQSIPFGIDDDGTIVGSCLKEYTARGFMRDPAGYYKVLRIPGAGFTLAYGVNSSAHKIVGVYRIQNHFHGFVYDYITEVFTTVDWPDPNTLETRVTGINSQGVIVGWTRIRDLPTFSFIGTPQ